MRKQSSTNSIISSGPTTRPIGSLQTNILGSSPPTNHIPTISNAQMRSATSSSSTMAAYTSTLIFPRTAALTLSSHTPHGHAVPYQRVSPTTRSAPFQIIPSSPTLLTRSTDTIETGSFHISRSCTQLGRSFCQSCGKNTLARRTIQTKHSIT